MLKEFLEYLRFEKRYSEHTLTAYSGDLEHMMQYFNSVYGLSDLSEAAPAHIRSWMVATMDEGTGARSIQRKISSLRSYYRYLMRRNMLSVNPLDKITLPKVRKKLPVFVDEKKMELLLDKVDFGDDFTGIRNRTIIELFYASGMRLSELMNLDINGVDFYNNQIKVLGKRNKERIIPVTREMAETLKNYIRIRNEITGESGRLFTRPDGLPMYPKLIYTIVHSYLNLISTQSRKSPHVLRHTFATHMLDKGADIQAIRELLGHSSLAATQVYTHNTLDKLKKTYRQSHPRA